MNKKFKHKKLVPLLALACAVGQPAGAQLYNTGNVYNTGAVYQAADFTNTATGQWVNAGSLSLTGNMTNDQAAMDPSTGLITFLGTGAQTVAGSMPYMSYNATINNAAGVTLTQILEVDGTGTFTQGIVTAQTAGMPMVFGPAAALAGVSDGSHVNGVARTLQTSGTFTYPVGNASYYRKIDANNISGNAMGLDAQYINGDAGLNSYAPNGGKDATPLLGYFPGEYWLMKPVAADVTAALTLYYGAPYPPNGIGSVADLRVAHKTNTSLWNEGNTATTGTIATGSVTSMPLDPAQWNLMTADAATPANVGWAPVMLGTISRATPLPLKLLSFAGSRSNGTDLLTWTTAQEKNVSYFEIQYSADAQSFVAIGTAAAKNNGNTTEAYSYPHNDVSGTAFYRLKMTNNDGTFTFSPVVRLGDNGPATTDAGQMSVYPVPFASVLNVTLTSDKDQPATFLLYDMNGSVVAKYTEQLLNGTNTYQLGGQLNALAPGTYVLRVAMDGNVVTKELVKQ